MIEELIEVADADFQEKVLQASLPVIVEFWAPWSSPSNSIAPILEDISDKFAGELVIARVNTDKDRDWAVRFCVQAIPTLLFVHRGSLLFEHLGAIPKPYLFELVEDFLNTARENPI